MKQIVSNLCTLLKTQGVEHPENNFKEATLEERQELIDLIGNKPSQFIDFYTKFQPFEVPTFWNSDVGLLSIERMVEESSNYAPSVYLSKLGIFTFAVTTGGNIIAIDINETKNGDTSVYIFDHEFCYEEYKTNELRINKFCISEEAQDYFGNEPIEFTYENVKRSEIKIEDSFIRFMQKLACDEYDDIESYFPYY